MRGWCCNVKLKAFGCKMSINQNNLILGEKWIFSSPFVIEAKHPLLFSIARKLYSCNFWRFFAIFHRNLFDIRYSSIGRLFNRLFGFVTKPNNRKLYLITAGPGRGPCLELHMIRPFQTSFFNDQTIKS